MPTITPYLWFNHNAEEAMQFYMSLFADAKLLNVMRYGDDVPGLGGTVMTATFQLAGQEFIALNGGPQFPFTQAVSFFITCETQAEVDHFWSALTADGGEEQPCGWLKDKFGLSWQVVPTRLGELMSDPDPIKAQAVVQAMLQMKKIEVAALEAAYAAA